MDARSIIANARTAAVHSVDYNRVMMYWHLGRRIFEEEQQGKERAETMAHGLSGASRNGWNPNMEVVSGIVNWLFAVNSIEFTQL